MNCLSILWMLLPVKKAQGRCVGTRGQSSQAPHTCRPVVVTRRFGHFRGIPNPCNRLKRILSPVLAWLLVWASPQSAQAEPGPQIQFRHTGNELELIWPAQPTSAGASVELIFELQHSSDLRQWTPVGERLGASAAGPDGFLRQQWPCSEPYGFYRLMSVERVMAAGLAQNGAEKFGFSQALAKELARIGQISPEAFSARYAPDIPYLASISWDPTQARFWDRFNADIQAQNHGKFANDPGYRFTDYRLDEAELALFKKHGFVVSERLGTNSFANAFYALWKDDMPVFISTDAILQAWHRSFDNMLAEVEETYLYAGLNQMLDNMANELPGLWSTAATGVLRESIQDADYFLAVARSLLSGVPVPALLGQQSRVTETLNWVKRENHTTIKDFFGVCRTVDFSQFTPRGHYTLSERLTRYFQAMMWCGRIDIMMAGDAFNRCDPSSPFIRVSPRETGIAIVLWQLLQNSGQFETWRCLDRIKQLFGGWTDSMDFAQLGSVLAAANLRSIEDIPDLATIERLQADLLRGDIGVQLIRSDYFVSPLGAEQIRLPQTFTVLGQAFVPDSWVLANLVYDSVIWDVDGTGGEEDKVVRRVPSCLDVAFSVIGNSQIVPELVARMTDEQAHDSTTHAVRFRDGLPYQHNLAATREVIDQLVSSAWEDTIYMLWLTALRELSVPTSDNIYPDTMRTRAWAMRTLNTQLASWTHLRHDTILYAKQSYTGAGKCFFPAGYVEPRPAFWSMLRRIAMRSAELIAELPVEGDLAEVQKNQVSFFGQFADTMATLQSLAEKELAGLAFNQQDELFIRNLLEFVGFEQIGSGRSRGYDGWYPRLFYRPAGLPDEMVFHNDHGSGKCDLLATDIHTDVPSMVHGDPGSVLHEAIGNVHLLILAIETGHEPTVFAGPVLSHYEFDLVAPPLRRLSNEYWQMWWCEDSRQIPDHPEWTRTFLVGNH